MVGTPGITTYIATTTSDIDVVRIVIVAAFALAFLAVVSGSVKKRRPGHIGWPFALIAIVSIVSSALVIGTTVDTFVQSQGGGLQRKSFEIEYWACGVELDIIDPQAPQRFSVGDGPYFEFNDKVARFQGVVAANTIGPNLSEFQRSIGGVITANDMVLPVTEAVVEQRIDGDSTDPSGRSRIDKFIGYDSAQDSTTLSVASGDSCGSQSAELQFYMYRTNPDNTTYTQEKVAFPSLVSFRDEKTIPDCVIVEFDVPNTRTGRLCSSLGERDQVRCQDFRTERSSNGSCDMRETIPYESEDN